MLRKSILLPSTAVTKQSKFILRYFPSALLVYSFHWTLIFMGFSFITTALDYLHGNRTIIFNSRDIIQVLAKKIGERSPSQYDNIEKSRTYIIEMLRKYGAEPVEEKYTVDSREYSNIIAEIPGKKKFRDEIIIIGAHYDSIEGSAGANDNATGIAGLIELYRILSKHTYRRTIRFVAFTLEEPPYFNSENMGSMVHASRCVKKKEKILLMISLDMLGFAGRFVKQDYPLEEMKEKYPSSGDFLSVTALPSFSQYAFMWKKIYNTHALKSNQLHEFVAPASVEGINLSDHMSFHKNGFPAILITDTGFYRNKSYHTEFDTEDTINYHFLAENIYAIGQTLKDILNKKTIP